MGQKVHPTLFRIKKIYDWRSRWIAIRPRDYARYLRDDQAIRKLIKHRLKDAGLAGIEIERTSGTTNIIVHTSRPGVVIGRGGKGTETLKTQIKTLWGAGPGVRKGHKSQNPFNLIIKEVRRPQLSAEIMTGIIIADLEKRVPFRRVMKQAVGAIERAGAEGVKIMVNGRLDGNEIARSEKFVRGKVPLNTMRADIDYARGAAHTTYGSVGVKVWIYRGEVFKNVPASEEPRANPRSK